MSDKYLIYLDQNILQYDFEQKMKIPELAEVQWVYSDEHFNEISRWEKSEFFDVLLRIKARKIKIQLDQNFQITNECRLLDYADPKSMYDEYQNTVNEYKNSTFPFIMMQAFLNGETNTITPEDIAQEFRSSFDQLLIFEDVTPEIQEKLDTISENLDKMAEDLKRTFIENRSKIPNIEDARKKVAGKSLSLLEKRDGPIVSQIWERVKKQFFPLSKDQLFGKEPLPYTGKESIPIFLSIVQCHSILNYLGYFPDQGISKMSKIFGMNSDAVHLAHSAYCSGFMSGDVRLCKKAEAVYEYFDYNKIIYQLNQKKSETK